jgi:hypothetical protein
MFGNISEAETHLTEYARSRAKLRIRFQGSLIKWNKCLSMNDTNINSRSSGYGDHNASSPRSSGFGFEYHIQSGYFVIRITLTLRILRVIFVITSNQKHIIYNIWHIPCSNAGRKRHPDKYVYVPVGTRHRKGNLKK